jgi:Outer membrane protein beta-barrel domain
MRKSMTSTKKRTRNRPILILSALSLIFAMPLGAEIGIKGGISLTGLLSSSGDFRHVLGYEINSLTMGNLMSFQAGIFKAFDLSGRLQIQPEISFAPRGGDASSTFVFDDIVYKIMIYYLEFPLILKYRIWTKGAFSAGIFAGPYAALKLKAEKQTVIWKVKKKTALDNVKTLDYGLVFGLGGAYDLSSGQVLLELRSGFGLKNMMDVLPGTIRLYPDKDHIRSFYFSVIMGYGF